jgi:hypothetical protein
MFAMYLVPCLGCICVGLLLRHRAVWLGVYLSGAALFLWSCMMAADNSWNCRGRNNVPLSKKKSDLPYTWTNSKYTWTHMGLSSSQVSCTQLLNWIYWCVESTTIDWIQITELTVFLSNREDVIYRSMYHTRLYTWKNISCKLVHNKNTETPTNRTAQKNAWMDNMQYNVRHLPKFMQDMMIIYKPR